MKYDSENRENVFSFVVEHIIVVILEYDLNIINIAINTDYDRNRVL